MNTPRKRIANYDQCSETPAEPSRALRSAEVLLTTLEVASLLRTSPSTIRFWRHRGYGPPGLKTGRRVLYRLEDVHAWLAERSAAERRS